MVLLGFDDGHFLLRGCLLRLDQVIFVMIGFLCSSSLLALILSLCGSYLNNKTRKSFLLSNLALKLNKFPCAALSTGNH